MYRRSHYRVLAALALASLVAGCATSQPKGDDSAEEEALVARLATETPDDPFHVVHVSEAAYVILLDVVPGSHADLLYPWSPELRRRLEAGAHVLQRPRSGPLYRLARVDAPRLASVGFVVLLATREPIDLAAFEPRLVKTLASSVARYHAELVEGSPELALDRMEAGLAGALPATARAVGVVPYWRGPSGPRAVAHDDEELQRLVRSEKDPTVIRAPEKSRYDDGVRGRTASEDRSPRPAGSASPASRSDGGDGKVADE